MKPSVRIEVYSPSRRESWDAFVRRSKNGTFLFFRDYMEYHGDRLVDHSLLLWDDKAELIALLPANRRGADLESHAGLTYGGFVTDERMKVPRMLEVFRRTLEFLRAEGEWQERVTLAQLEAGVRWRIWRVAAGRMPVGYGPRTGEGIIFGGRVAVDQIAVQSVAPVRLPVGLAWGHMFLGRFRRSQNPRRPYVWGGAIAWQPHPRLQVSILRGAMFAGDSAAKPFSWRQFARVVIPVKNTNEENHVYSFATWYRPPIERWWPLVVALEWGADDSAGALDERPGVRLQLYAPLPSGGGAGLMWSRLGTRPGLGFTGHGPWYHHGVELGPWIAEAQALGLALGGELSEVQGYAHGTAAAGRASWALSLGARRRSVDNLYAPLRIGRANVGALNLSWRPTGRFEVQATGSLERGKRWTSREFRLATLWRLW